MRYLMLSVAYIVLLMTLSTQFLEFPFRTITRLIVTFRFLIPLRYCRYTFGIALCGIFLSALPITASQNQTEDAQRQRFFGDHTQTDPNQPTIPSSTKSFSFDDILQIQLNLDIPGNIRIVAIDNKEEIKNTISVTLEKRVKVNQSIITNSFLDKISISGKKTDGTLQLNALLPDDTSKELLENKNIKEHLQLNYAIKTPPDVSVQLNVKDGDVYLHHLRGTIEITNDMGDIHLDETLGTYEVVVKKGRIHGKILLTPGKNEIKTENGSIDLSILDELAVPLELTTLRGDIRLLLPNNYPADVEFNSETNHIIINLPSDIDINTGVINGGGPLLRLTATDTISILPNPRLRRFPEDSIPSSMQQDISSDKMYPIHQTMIPPTIDGNLSESVWLDATALPAFQNPMGTNAAENPTDVYLMWDLQNIYIGVRAHIKKGQIPRVSQTQQDSPIWEDESVEILFDTNPGTLAYSHLIINPIGGIFDQWVVKVGSPNFRFAPNDVKREQTDESEVQFKGDSSWNSNAIVATDINANYWSLEIAIPNKLKDNKSIETLLFNVFRKSQVKLKMGEIVNPVVQREYSYWMPIYDEKYPWWPHWKEGMGKLVLSKKQSTIPESYEVSEKFIVDEIEIEGNMTIPTENVLEMMPIESGDTVTNEQLSRLLAELDNYDWFQEVQLKTAVIDTDDQVEQSDKLSGGTIDNPVADDDIDSRNEEFPKTEPLKVTVQISVTEAPVQFARQVTVKGNKSFPAKFIKDWLDISPGYIAEANANLKQQMITDFYVNRGFPFAEVSHQFVNDGLLYHISEGYLDEIRFTGNRSISRAELISALDLDTEGVYFHSLGQARINNMDTNLSKSNEAFKSINDWQVQREGGKNIMIVDIKEQSLVKPGWFPVVGYNRVHGIVLGAGGTLSTRYIDQENIFGSVSLGVSSKKWNYHVGVENTFFERFHLTVGVGLFNLTDLSSNGFRLRPAEISLSDSFYGTSADNFFQREGQHFWIANKFGQHSQLRLEYTLENHDNLFKSTDWSYLQRSLVKLGNRRIDTGNLNIVSLIYTFDTRDHKSSLDGAENVASQMILRPNERTRRGWRGNLGVEIAGGPLAGDFTYNVYKFELARYNPLIGQHNLNIRIVGDFADTALPRQRLLYLGGSTTLRGYRFNSFAGDQRILLNFEHRYVDEIPVDTGTDAYIGWSLSTFIDIGQVWQYDENPFSDLSVQDFKSSIGVGFSFFVSPFGSPHPLTNAFDISLPLTLDSSLRTPRIVWRLERMF